MSFHKFNKDSSLRKLRFKQNKDKYIRVGTLILSIVVIIIGILYFSFAKYESSREFSAYNATVGEFVSGDVTLKFYKVGTTTEIEPRRGLYNYVNGTCNNDASITWDEASYGPIISNITKPTNCQVFMEETAVKFINNIIGDASTNTLDVIINETPDAATCTNTLGYDNTTDNNLRYVGSNPCNYVYFNCTTTNPEEMSDTTCEVWRIIGIINNVDDGTGNKETRMKIIRRDSLGSYSWDTSSSSVNNGKGINQWGPSTNYSSNATYEGADIMRELNTDYLNLSLTTNTNWYNGENNAKTGVFDYTKRLNANAQNMISNAVWYTGAHNDTSIAKEDGISNVTTPNAYINERESNPHATNHGKYCTSSSNVTCKDTIERTYTWVGKVGLVYPSDFGYSTSGSSTDEIYTREKCLNEVFLNADNYGNASYGSCGETAWIHMTSGHWSISPFAQGFEVFVTDIYAGGRVGLSRPHKETRAIHPSVYLNSNIKIISGDGSETNPYTLGL